MRRKPKISANMTSDAFREVTMKVRSLIHFTVSAVAIVLATGVDEAAASDLAASLALVSTFGIVVPATEQTPANTCITINGDEFCLVRKKHGGTGGGQPQNGTPGGGPQGGAGAPQNGTGGGAEAPENNPAPTTQTEPGEHACPAGYVVLDKPNKYGSFCEPKEGFPETPATPATPAEPNGALLHPN
jgi:hypothetical protein